MNSLAVVVICWARSVTASCLSKGTKGGHSEHLLEFRAATHLGERSGYTRFLQYLVVCGLYLLPRMRGQRGTDLSAMTRIPAMRRLCLPPVAVARRAVEHLEFSCVVIFRAANIFGNHSGTGILPKRNAGSVETRGGGNRNRSDMLTSRLKGDLSWDSWKISPYERPGTGVCLSTWGQDSFLRGGLRLVPVPW